MVLSGASCYRTRSPGPPALSERLASLGGCIPPGTYATVRIAREAAKAGDPFEAILARSVRGASGNVVLDAGTRLVGHAAKVRSSGLAIVFERPRLDALLVKTDGDRGLLVLERGSPLACPILAEVPAGTRLLVRLDQELDTEHVAAGTEFRLTVLEAQRDPSGDVLVPIGAAIRGKITERRSAGELALRVVFQSIETVLGPSPFDAYVKSVVSDQQASVTRAPAPSPRGSWTESELGPPRASFAETVGAEPPATPRLRLTAGAELSLLTTAPIQFPAPAR